MRAVQLTARETLAPREVPTPRPGFDDVLIRVRAAGLCDTDLMLYRRADELAALGFGLPVTLGHELAGEVAEVGSLVTAIRPGDRVVVEPNIGCGDCPICREGRPDVCARLGIVGMSRDGAFAEYVVVPARFTHVLPEKIDFVTAAGLAEPLACALHGYRRTRLQPGEDVLVVGDGFFGLVFTLAARALGARSVAVLGHHESRLARVRARGADLALDERAAGATESVMALGDGLGSAVVIDTVGSSASLELALRLVRPGGRIGIFGGSGEPLRIDPVMLLMLKSPEIHSLIGNPFVWPDVLRLLDEGIVDTSGLISHVLPLSDLERAFALKAGRDADVVKIVIKP